VRAVLAMCLRSVNRLRTDRTQSSTFDSGGSKVFFVVAGLCWSSVSGPSDLFGSTILARNWVVGAAVGAAITALLLL